MVKLEFHRFTLGDVEDPDIYAAQPIWEWQQTDKGRWVMDHAIDPSYSIRTDPHSYAYMVVIYGTLEDRAATEYILRYGK